MFNRYTMVYSMNLQAFVHEVTSNTTGLAALANAARVAGTSAISASDFAVYVTVQSSGTVPEPEPLPLEPEPAVPPPPPIINYVDDDHNWSDSGWVVGMYYVCTTFMASIWFRTLSNIKDTPVLSLIALSLSVLSTVNFLNLIKKYNNKMNQKK